MKKNFYESVLQAITEIDLCEASCEDMLRIGISAEQGAINLYNRIAKELEKRSESSLFELFKDVSLEEKAHVGEFQAALEKFDYEEWPTATIAKFVLGYYNKINENPNKKYSQEQKKVYELALRAKKKFENALEFKEYLDKTPEMKTKLSELISSPNLLGKHRS